MWAKVKREHILLTFVILALVSTALTCWAVISSNDVATYVTMGMMTLFCWAALETKISLDAQRLRQRAEITKRSLAGESQTPE